MRDGNWFVRRPKAASVAAVTVRDHG